MYLSFFSAHCECLPKKRKIDYKKIAVRKGQEKGEQKQGLEKPTGIVRLDMMTDRILSIFGFT